MRIKKLIIKKNKKEDSWFFVLGKNKKAISLMVSYVLLISIVFTLSILVYAILKNYPNIVKAPIDCKEGTTILLEDYDCTDISSVINLTVKNNGLFNIDGFVLLVGDDNQRQPIERPELYVSSTYPNMLDFGEGHYVFESELKNGEIFSVLFTMPSDIQIVQLQPFILDEKNQKVMCKDSAFTQVLESCTL